MKKRRKFEKSVFFFPALFLAIWMILPFVWAPEAAAAPEKIQLKFGGSNTGTLVYMICGVLVDVWTKNIPDLGMTLMATPGSTANHLPIERGELDIGASATSADWWAMNGMHFTKTKVTNFCALIPITMAFQQVITYADSPMKSWKDLDAKRVALGARASPASITSEEIFQGLNIKPKSVLSSPTEAADMIKDKRVDAFAYGVGAPYSLFMDIATAIPIKFVPMAPDEQAYVVKAVPHMFPTVMPPKTYSFQNEGYLTMAAYPSLIVRPALSEEVVYKLTKVAWEHWDEVVKAVPAAKWVSPKDIVNMVAPVHPGGVKYYREIGISIPDRLIWKK